MLRTETAFLDLSERPITVTVLIRMRALNLQLPEGKILLIPSICILEKSLQDYHFLHLLPTDIRNLTIPGTIAFRPSVKVFGRISVVSFITDGKELKCHR
jgi:hypothetical protein